MLHSVIKVTIIPPIVAVAHLTIALSNITRNLLGVSLRTHQFRRDYYRDVLFSKPGCKSTWRRLLQHLMLTYSRGAFAVSSVIWISLVMFPIYWLYGIYLSHLDLNLSFTCIPGNFTSSGTQLPSDLYPVAGSFSCYNSPLADAYHIENTLSGILSIGTMCGSILLFFSNHLSRKDIVSYLAMKGISFGQLFDTEFTHCG
jgi:hypothetical protein